jgi:simple sugar transport system permease protein
MFQSSLDIMTPLLLAGLGGLFTELAGMLDIALEGMLLSGAFAAVAVAHFSGSLFWGVLGGLFFSMLLAALHALVTLRLGANVFITGLAVNMLSSGLTVLLAGKLFDSRGVVTFNNIPGLPLFLGRSVFFYLALLSVLLCHLALFKTPFGQRLRCCTDNRKLLSSLGITSDNYRFSAFLIAGFFCGLGGAALSLPISGFVPGMSSGNGWIALVVIFLGGKRPLGLLAAAFVFGLSESFSNYAQGLFSASGAAPLSLILALPYLFTLVVMVAVSAAKPRNR